MAVGWAGDNAVNDQIQDSVNDEVKRARRNVPNGESLQYCEECGEESQKMRPPRRPPLYLLSGRSGQRTKSRQPLQPPRQQRFPITLRGFTVF